MKLTQGQKKWVVGGGIAAAALLVGRVLFGGRPAFAGPALSPGRSHEKHDHKRRKRDRDDHDHGHDNGRGEYGRKHRGKDRGHD